MELARPHLIIELILLGIIVLVAAFTLYKLRRAHLLLYGVQAHLLMSEQKLRGLISKGLEELYHQQESLDGLVRDLELQKSLPSTRGWSASPDFLLEVVRHVQEATPRTMMECGSGVSTIILARCAQLNNNGGHVYSLEHSADFAAETRRELERHGLSSYATVMNASLKEYQIAGEVWPWYALDELPKIAIDLLLVDGPPGNLRKLARYPAGPLLFHALKSGAAVFVDDADREDEKAVVERWRREFPALRTERKRCEKGCVILKN